MRVMLVDDHPLVLQALSATVLQINPDIALVPCDTLAGARQALCCGDAARLVLLDLNLPDSQGISGLLALKALAPDVPVAVVSASDNAESVQTALVCGAAGFISKSSGVTELAAAVETLLLGESWFPDHGTDAAPEPLTRPQARILEGVHRGMMNKQIAHEMGISEATVKYHLTGIFRKLGVHTRAQLLTLARDRPPQPSQPGDRDEGRPAAR